MITSITALSVVGFAFLYWKGWAGITYVGVTKPLCQVSLFGFSFWIKSPEKDA